MKDYEKKLLKFALNEKIKNKGRIFYGLVNDIVCYGDAYFFGLVNNNLLDTEKFEQIHIEKLITNNLLNADDERLIKPDFYITKGSNKLVLANFKICYDSNNRVSETVACNYNYYKLFEKDVCYIYDAKGMLCLYDERKDLIGVIAKVVSR